MLAGELRLQGVNVLVLEKDADPTTWAEEFERLMIELARVSRQVRQRS